MTTTVGSAANSYEILLKLAEGGMAEIFLARSATGAGARRHVVLKRVSRERAFDTQYVRMFLDEAQLAAQLSHPNIAQVFDIGRLGTSYFFTMEYVHGVTVQALIERAREHKLPLPIGAVLAVLAGAAAGLGHAHQRVGVDGRPLNIVHRDVSPSNLMVSFDGHVKVVDFGVAKAVGRPETQAGEIKGKVAYLSPEQCRQQKLDRRSDLFSLGIVAWEMLTGRRLFRRDTAFETMAAIATEPAPPPTKWRTDLPPAIDRLVGRLLALEPAARFQNAAQVIEAIELTAQQTTSAMTPATLARLLRDLFGVLPEPWLVLEREAVTVIASPIPDVLDSPDDPERVEAKLTTQFSSVSIVTPATPQPALPPVDHDDEEMAMTNVLVSPPEDSEHARETRIVPILANEEAKASFIEDVPTERDPQRARPATRPPIRHTEETVAARPQHVAPALLADTVIDSPIPATPVPMGPKPVTLMGSGPFAPLQRSRAPSSGPPVARPGSGPQQPNLPAAPYAPPLGTGPRPLPAPGVRKSAVYPVPLRWWIVGGSALGVVLTTVIVLATRGDEPAPIVEAPSDAAKPVAIPDAAVADAAIVVMADAEEVDAAPDAAPEPDDTEELAAMTNGPKPTGSRLPKLRTKADMNAYYRMRRFKEIVAACRQVGADGDRAVVCTWSACWVHDAVAQDWFRNIKPTQRDSTIKECKKHGALIEDVCEQDPGACRE